MLGRVGTLWILLIFLILGVGLPESIAEAKFLKNGVRAGDRSGLNVVRRPGKNTRKRILAPGERILWQGAPQATFKWTSQNTWGAILGAGFALPLFIAAEPHPLLAWIVLPLAAAFAIFPFLWQAFVRRHSFYTLTTRKGYFGTDMPILGRKLKSHPITGQLVRR